MPPGAEPDVHLLARIAATEQQIRSNINLIPINNWGFDEDVLDRLKQRKHSMVNEQLTKGEKHKLSNAAKQRLARGLRSQCRTVGDVLDWMAHSKLNTKPARNTSKNRNNNTNDKKEEKTKVVKKDGDATKSVAEPPKVKRSKMDMDGNEESSSRESSQERMEEAESDADEDDETMNTSEDRLTPKAKAKTAKTEGESTTPPARKSGSAKKAEMKKKRALEQQEKREKKESAPKGESQTNGAEKVKANVEVEKRMREVDPIEGRRLALQKLQKRINELKCMRKSTKSAQQHEEQRKLKRRMSVMKRREKKRAAKGASKEKSEGPSAKRSKLEGGEGTVKQPRNEAGQLVYSKFDFIVKDEKQKEGKKEKRDKFVGKDYGRLLKKAEKRKERLNAIRERDPEKAEHIEEGIRWNNAMNRAEGLKVKDNPELLKKGIKRKERIKERSKKKWTSRMDHIKDKQTKQQDKRESNLQARRDAVKKKKIDRAKKKGRML